MRIWRIGLTTLALLCAASVAVAETRAAPDSGTADVNGIRMYYRIEGAGEPLLLLHGGFSNTNHWHEQLEAFAAKYQVVAVDSRGHGRTNLGSEPLSYSLMAADVLALMDYLGIPRAHIVGWSDGGNIGLDIAINHPDRLLKLVAYGANYAPAGVRSDAASNPKFTAYIERARQEYQELSPEPERWDEFVENISAMWASQPNFTAAELGSITAPVLVLDGIDEEAIYIEHAESLAALVPSAELELMPGTGHFAMWEKPHAFNRIVLDFLAR